MDFKKKANAITKAKRIRIAPKTFWSIVNPVGEGVGVEVGKTVGLGVGVGVEVGVGVIVGEGVGVGIGDFKT